MFLEPRSGVSRPVSSASTLCPPLDEERQPIREEEPEVVKVKSHTKISIRDRLKHFTWAWYTLTMSTGGLAVLIANQPYTFPGLTTIGIVVYFLNIFFFVVISSCLAARFILHGCLLDSLRHEREGLFFPTMWLSVATIICGLHKYFAGETPSQTLSRVEVALFWAYCACTFIVAVAQYSFVFSEHTYPLQTMMPSWILPAFPIMLSGTIASVIASPHQQPISQCLAVVIAGLTFQGLGMMISVLMYAHYIGRLMQAGLPCREHRPGMFICVGPPAFTALALIGMANALPRDTPIFFLVADADDHALVDAAVVLRLLATASAAFLWALSLWFFSIAAVAVLRAPPKAFHLSWWAMVFPNTGFTIATITLGNALGSTPVRAVGSAMSVCVACMWCFVLVNNFRAVWNKSIVYPGRDEDSSD